MGGEAEPVGFVTIRDEIRTSAAETIGYFNEQGVTLNVIRGDDPRTAVSYTHLVSHSMEQVERICQRAVWIEKGDLRMDGPVDEVCKAYREQFN